MAKKAGMDAKKSALRTEDISKGVFVPVSNLPINGMGVYDVSYSQWLSNRIWINSGNAGSIVNGL